jgi:hypothetical protein
MSDIRLKTPIDQSFTRAKSGAVWGRIYFEIDSAEFFPDIEWTDMAVAFEVAWLRALFGLAEKQSVYECVRFYDGPFTVSVSLEGLGVVKLSLIHKEVVRSVVEASIESLLQDAILGAKESLAACVERNWNNADSEALAALLKRVSHP